jgi:hypothetical protein
MSKETNNKCGVHWFSYFTSQGVLRVSPSDSANPATFRAYTADTFVVNGPYPTREDAVLHSKDQILLAIEKLIRANAQTKYSIGSIDRRFERMNEVIEKLNRTIWILSASLGFLATAVLFIIYKV